MSRSRPWSESSSEKGVLARLAHACGSRPKLVIAMWTMAAALLFVVGEKGASSLEGTDILIEGTRSADAVELEGEHFGEGESLAVLLEGRAELLDRHGPQAARRLARVPDVNVLSPWSTSAPRLLRPKRSQALLVLRVARSYDATGRQTVPAVRKALGQTLPKSIHSHITGSAALAAEFNRVGFSAARRSERIAAPLLAVVLLLVFRSPVAALIPALLGFAVIAFGGGIVALLSRVVSLDAVATTTMSMMGLALGVDYSLLLVSRFREELRNQGQVAVALERTARTAGRTVIFAGAVLMLAMLAAQLVLPGGMMTSATTGVAGAAVIATTGAATLLPALLALLAPHLDRWRIGRRSPKARVGPVVKRLVRRPVVATAAVLIPLLLLSSAASGTEVGAPAATALPKGNPARADYERIEEAVGGGWASVFTVIAVSDDGPITEEAKLRRLDEFQNRLAREYGVGAVLGPAALNERSAQLRKSAREFASGQDRLGGLARSLGDAKRGVGELRQGIARGNEAAGALDWGLGRSFDGAMNLDSAVSESALGSRRLRDAISGARAGAMEIAAAAAQIEAGSALVKDGSTDFASELDAGREGLEAMRKAGTDATAEIGLALAALDRTTAATKADPQFAEAYAQVATALGTLTGEHPQTGTHLQSGYYGLESSLATAIEQNQVAANEAEHMASGATKIEGGLTKLGEGSRSLGDGLAEILSGADLLTTGLQRMRGRLGPASNSKTFLGGMRRLQEGASRLSGGLADGHEQSAPLEGGLQSATTEVTQYQLRSSDAEQQEEAVKSGYFLLANLDSADTDERQNAGFALNWERGGSGSRIMVVPASLETQEVDAGPQVMKDLTRLNEELNGMGPGLADALNADVAVGGRGAVLTDFVNTVRDRLFPLLLALLVVALVILTLVFRSPLLAFKAVILNMLTVGAAFGVLALVSRGSSPLIGGPGFLDPISIMGILTIVFALSIDYEVFLITRMREGYAARGTTEGAIAYGIDHTARIITGAAAIMISVFFVFGMSDYLTLRLLGIGLGVAVFLDATAVRLILLPATMKLFGRANWWMPRWLDRVLPEISVEGKAR